MGVKHGNLNVYQEACMAQLLNQDREFIDGHYGEVLFFEAQGGAGLPAKITRVWRNPDNFPLINLELEHALPDGKREMTSVPHCRTVVGATGFYYRINRWIQ